MIRALPTGTGDFFDSSPLNQDIRAVTALSTSCQYIKDVLGKPLLTPHLLVGVLTWPASP